MKERDVNRKLRKPLVMAILDGWGVGPKDKNINALEAAKTPFFDYLKRTCPYTQLQASGRAVGLETNQMSGSEAGHLNIGAGRVVTQDVRIILEDIANGSFFYNPAFLAAINHTKVHNSNIHLVGLMGNSDSPHAHPDIALALLVLLQKHKMKDRVFLHLFTDGRDSFPKSAMDHYKKWKGVLDALNLGEIATISGRFYGMDRAKNWDRLMKSYDAMVYGKAKKFHSFEDALTHNYLKGNTDEYIEPSILMKNGIPVANIKDNDSVIFFNFRSDRARQFSKLFVGTNTAREKNFPDIDMLKNISFVAMTNFGPDLELKTAFNSDPLQGTLPSSLDGLKQLYIAETEKFSHVTYFINGGYPDSVGGEDRIMVNSPKVRSYAEIPQMAANEVANVIKLNIKHDVYDFITVNFANTDMVGHTGDFKATVQAAEFVDEKIKELHKEINKKGGDLIVTADHGNADIMIDKISGKKFTFHTKNPVPFILASRNKDLKNIKLEEGKLANITPTILSILNRKKPQQMIAESLILKK